MWAPFAPKLWKDIRLLLPHIPINLQRLTLYLCCFRGYELSFLVTEAWNSLGWEATRRELDRLSNLKELSFIIQHHKRLVIDREPAAYNREAFDMVLGIMLEQEFFSFRERGILSVQSSVVVKFGPLD